MSATTSPVLATETVDFLYEAGKGGLDLQIHTADALDSKTVQAFAAASVVVGLAAVSGSGRNLTLLATAVLAYTVVSVATAIGLWTRELRVPASPTQLWRRYWADSVPSIKHALVADLAAGYQKNNEHLRSKAKCLRWCLAGVAVESLAVGLALLVSLR